MIEGIGGLLHRNTKEKISSYFTSGLFHLLTDIIIIIKCQ